MLDNDLDADDLQDASKLVRVRSFSAQTAGTSPLSATSMSMQSQVCSRHSSGGSGPVQESGLRLEGQACGLDSPRRTMIQRRHSHNAIMSNISDQLVYRPSNAITSEEDMMEDAAAKLECFSLFQGTNREFLQRLVQKYKPRLYKPTDPPIIKYGDVGRAMYFIYKGVVEVMSEDGETLYARLGEGKFFGEVAILFSVPRTATIVAATKCICFSLRKEDLEEVLGDFPAVARSIRQVACDRFAAYRKLHAEKYGDEEQLSSHLGRSRRRPGGGEDEQMAAAEGDREFMNTLAQDLQATHYPTDSVVCKPGDPADSVFFVKDGSVRLTDSNNQVVEHVGPMQHFGEVAVALQVPHAVTATATEDTWLYAVPRCALDDYLQQCPTMQTKLLATAAQRTGTAGAVYLEGLGQGCFTPEAAGLGPSQWRGPMDMVAAELRASIQGVSTPVAPPSSAAVDDRDGQTDLAACMSSVAASVEDINLPEAVDGGDSSEAILDAGGEAVATSACLDAPEGQNTATAAEADGLFSGGRVDREVVGGDSAEAKCAAPEQPTGPTIAAEMPHAYNTTVDRLKRQAMRKRSPSVAVWNSSLMMEEFARYSSAASKKQQEARDTQHKAEAPLVDRVTLVKIFLWLGTQDLHRVMAVCRLWHEVVENSEELWRTIDLLPANKLMKDAVVDSMLTRFGKYTMHLSLRNCWGISDHSLLSVRANCRMLRAVSCFSCWDLTSAGVTALAEGCPSLAEVDLSNCRKITDEAIVQLANRCIYIEHLELSYCKNLTDVSLDYVLARCRRLTFLNLLRCTGLSKDGFGAFTRHRAYELQTLVLADLFQLTDVGIEHVAQGCPSLATLNLSFCCSLGPTSLATLGQWCSKLQQVDLTSCTEAVTDQSITLLIQSASMRQALRILMLRNCSQITDEGLRTLNSLCTNLKILNVANCKGVTEAGAMACDNIGHIVLGPPRRQRATPSLQPA